MERTGSIWRLIATCSSCGRSLTLTDTAVLLHRTWIGPRGVVLDVLGERWPEPGSLFHPRCFGAQFGRGALWASFVRGRFDKGVPGDADSEPGSAIGEVVPEYAGWDLSVTCCVCAMRVDASAPAIVRTLGTSRHWNWVPALQDRRPGQPQVCHLSCFVKTHGRKAAYAAVGRQAWATAGPLIRTTSGAIPS